MQNKALQGAFRNMELGKYIYQLISNKIRGLQKLSIWNPNIPTYVRSIYVAYL